MLAKANRVREPREFRRIVRRGSRRPTASGMIYIAEARDSVPRFGFIVSKSVGNAVVRNRVRRRMSEVVRAELSTLPLADVVIRAFPAAADHDFAELAAELAPGLRMLR